ncbi:hypothetical protein DL767_001530 [Monosporascus sp. MG133]|nr:hypothetical protein DL767_001530 [Monosporascus sp. MG133]
MILGPRLRGAHHPSFASDGRRQTRSHLNRWATGGPASIARTPRLKWNYTRGSPPVLPGAVVDNGGYDRGLLDYIMDERGAVLGWEDVPVALRHLEDVRKPAVRVELDKVLGMVVPRRAAGLGRAAPETEVVVEVEAAGAAPAPEAAS